MEKNVYIRPQINAVKMLTKCHFISGSVESDEAYTREVHNTTWDEEEEEEDNLGGWFK